MSIEGLAMYLALIGDVLAQVPPASPPAVGTPADPQKTISFILGLPATVAAAFGSFYVVRKARLDTRKAELETLKLERELSVAQESENPAEAARIIAGPIFDSRRAQDLVLRFVFLYLILQAWGLVGKLFGSALSGAAFGLDRATEGGDSVWTILGHVGLALVASLPGIVSDLLFVIVGWPLLLDITRLLHIDLLDFVYREGTRRLLIALAVIAALSSSLLVASLTAF